MELSFPWASAPALPDGTRVEPWPKNTYVHWGKGAKSTLVKGAGAGGVSWCAHPEGGIVLLWGRGRRAGALRLTREEHAGRHVRVRRLRLPWDWTELLGRRFVGTSDGRGLLCVFAREGDVQVARFGDYSPSRGFSFFQ